MQRTFLRGLPVETQTDLLANYIRSHDQTCLGFEPPGLCQESRIALFVISWPDMMAGGHPDAIDSFFLMGLRSAAHGMLYYQRHASKGYARAVTYLEGSMKLQFMPVMEAQSSVKSALHLFRITRRMLLSAYDMADDRTLLPADKTLLFMRTYDEGDDKAYTSYVRELVVPPCGRVSCAVPVWSNFIRSSGSPRACSCCSTCSGTTSSTPRKCWNWGTCPWSCAKTTPSCESATRPSSHQPCHNRITLSTLSKLPIQSAGTSCAA